MANQPGAQHFGGRLRAARERRGISLRQIASATKISVAVLEALERNDFSRLPGGIFSRAFIRSYAVEVGLDPEQTIAEFLDELPVESPTAVHHTPEPIEDHDAIESDRQAASTLVRLLAFSIPIAALVIYAGVRGLRPVTTPRPAPAPPAQAAEPVSVPAPPVVPSEAAEPVPAQPGAGAAAKPAAEGAATTGADSAAKPGADEQATPVADRLTMTLEVSRPCWLSIVVDGQSSPSGVMQPGERRTVEARRDVVFTAGDAAALTLTLNGEDARPLGKAGEVVTARVTPANFKEFLANR